MVPPTILIVEDDVATGEFYAELLDLNGYQARVATTGKGALAAIAQHAVQGVLLDRRLPDIDGIQLCRQLRDAFGPDVPIILLTADYSAELTDGANAAGASEYLRKPIEPAVLLGRIAALVQP
jgi:DNA-binding response OmpR family regulator